MSAEGLDRELSYAAGPSRLTRFSLLRIASGLMRIDRAPYSQCTHALDTVAPVSCANDYVVGGKHEAVPAI